MIRLKRGDPPPVIDPFASAAPVTEICHRREEAGEAPIPAQQTQQADRSFEPHSRAVLD
jgi:hypothetical protein